MFKLTFPIVITTLVAALGCGTVVPPEELTASDEAAPSCTVACSVDTDCPDGQACGDLGLCTAGETCPCTADEFLACDGDTAMYCNATGDGVTREECAAGCNADAARCNECVPNSATCTGGQTGVETCGPDGLPSEVTECSQYCVPGTTVSEAHCAYLEPMYLPDICDAPAQAAALELANNIELDTSADATCNGGIVAQTNGPEICVIRHSTITISANILIRGARAAAFVSDGPLQMQGTIDASATGRASGPGGGYLIAGARVGQALGGGGAGFATPGAAGGGAISGGGGSGGAAIDPMVTRVFTGGARPNRPTGLQPYHPWPGGGGGALMLVSCRDAVAVSGVIDAGGGGGEAGRDTNTKPGAVTFVGGAGGGAGGYIVLQGFEVRVASTTGGLFANGGAGGGGCSLDGCQGVAGANAGRTANAAVGGRPSNEGGTGGNGGTSSPPTFGLASYYSPGGGGGAAGRIHVFTPDYGKITIGAAVSPALQRLQTLPTR